MLYVLDACGGNDIEEYPPGRTTPSVTITNGVSSPSGATIDRNQTLYISNDAPPSIAEYSYGSTSPSRTITGQGLGDPLGLAIAHNGGLYIADYDAAQVFLIPFGTSNVVPLNLQGVSKPLAVAVEPKTGDLWVGDGASGNVEIYRPGSVVPTKTVTGLMYPYAISIEQNGRQRGTAVVGDIDQDAIWAYRPGRHKPYAEVTNGVSFPEGLLLTTP
jgi:serine/threonine-protein kinase